MRLEKHWHREKSQGTVFSSVQTCTAFISGGVFPIQNLSCVGSRKQQRRNTESKAAPLLVLWLDGQTSHSELTSLVWHFIFIVCLIVVGSYLWEVGAV